MTPSPIAARGVPVPASIAPLKRAGYDLRTGLPRVIEMPGGRMDIVADYRGRLTRRTMHLTGDTSREAISGVSPGGRIVDVLHVDGTRGCIAYDTQGRPASMRDGDVQVTFAYDALSRLTRRRASVDGRELIENFAYDALGRLAHQSIEVGGAVPMKRSLSFTWRADGKMNTRTWWEGDLRLRAERMEYDARGRLVAHVVTEAEDDELPRDEAGNAYVAQSFTYDAMDNLVTVRTDLRTGEIDVARYEYALMDRDRLVSITHDRPEYGPPVALDYDANGDIVDDGRGHVLAWDEAAQLKAVSDRTGTSSYAHGPDGHVCTVVRAGTTTFRYRDNGAVAAEFVGADERRYIRAGGTVVAETCLAGAVRQTWLLGSDGQGTVLVESAATPQTRTYGAYGARDTSTDHARTGFAGDVHDEASSCYLLGNRLYSPTLRRFLNPDPVSPFGSGGLNRYAYCGGDPVNRVDPGGNSWLPILFSALGLVAAIVGAVASAGALAGAIGTAGGGLAAAISTPTMAITTAAVAMETVSVVAEAGSLAALATGEDGLATMFGALAFGTGLASTGLSTVASALSATRRFVGRGLGDRSRGVGSSSMAEPSRQFTFMTREQIHPSRSAVNRLTGQPFIKPVVHSFVHPSNRRSLNHFVDSPVFSSQLPTMANTIARGRLPGQRKTAVYVYGGAHGDYKTPNFGPEIRNPELRSKELWDHDVIYAEQLQRALGDDFEVFLENVGRMTREHFRDRIKRSGHHVHWYCFSLADNVAIAELRIPGDIPLTDTAVLWGL